MEVTATTMDNILKTVGNFFSGLSWQIYAGVAALALIGGTVWYCNEQVEERVEVAEELGGEKERTKQFEQTIENVGKANEAREDIEEIGPTGDAVRYRQCLRTARTPANCERFLPAVPADNSGD